MKGTVLALLCPYCQHADTKVVDKRESDVISTRRRRECLDCHQRFTTYERVESTELSVAKHDGRREPFNPEKLRKGITLAITKRPVTSEQVDQLLEQVETDLRATKGREVPADLIGTLVMDKLKSLDHVAYIRFASVYRDFADVESFQDEVQQLLGRHRKKVR